MNERLQEILKTTKHDRETWGQVLARVDSSQGLDSKTILRLLAVCLDELATLIANQETHARVLEALEKKVLDSTEKTSS